MTNWKSVRIAVGAVVLGLVAVASSHAVGVAHENKLTFNKPVALPGVVLPAGSYSFDLADSNSLDVVVVRNSARTKVFYMGFTQLVRRPAEMSKNAPVTFGEAPAGQATPIATWYEIGGSLGHEFLYR
jgi:hypothetical protein